MADEHENEPDKYHEVEGVNSSVESLGTVGLVSKPKTSSAVWNYYGIKTDSSGNPLVDELEKSVCKLCEKSVPAKGSNTSNLLKHLESSHPEAYSEVHTATRVKDMKEPTIKETINSSKPYNANSPQAQELNRAVASFITNEMQPYQIVEKPGFKKMVSKLHPKYSTSYQHKVLEQQ